MKRFLIVLCSILLVGEPCVSPAVAFERTPLRNGDVSSVSQTLPSVHDSNMIKRTPLTKGEESVLASMDSGSLDGVTAGQEKPAEDKSQAILWAVFIVLILGIALGVGLSS